MSRYDTTDRRISARLGIARNLWRSTLGLTMAEALRICLFNASGLQGPSFREPFEDLGELEIIGEASTWEELRRLPGTQGPLTFSPDGQLLATHSRAGISLWPMAEAKPSVNLHNSTNLLFRHRPGPWFRLGSPRASSC